MNRRESLHMLTGAALAAEMLRLGVGDAMAARNGAEPAQEPAGTSALETRLKKDVDSLAPRVYSDEGIPVLLACIDLTPRSAPALTAFNADLAAQIRDTTVAWERLYLQAKPEDVSKLIEVLAARDFESQVRAARGRKP